METSYQNNKKFIACGFILLLLGIIAAGMVSAYFTILEKDHAVSVANESLSKNPEDVATQTIYNFARQEYVAAITQFPGNIVGPITGYPKDKWGFAQMSETQDPWWVKPEGTPETERDSIARSLT